MQIRQIRDLPPGLDELARAATDEGHQHVARLIGDFKTGANRFDAPGEALFACFEAERPVAVGGLNRDPYLQASQAHPGGRVRRVYVHPDHRRAGVGARLIKTIESHAAKHFDRLQLFTSSCQAGRFYRALGFERVAAAEKVSHAKRLSKS